MWTAHTFARSETAVHARPVTNFMPAYCNCLFVAWKRQMCRNIAHGFVQFWIKRSNWERCCVLTSWKPRTLQRSNSSHGHLGVSSILSTKTCPSNAEALGQTKMTPPTHTVWHWTNGRVSLRKMGQQTTYSRHARRIISCPRQHPAITHKPAEETLRLTGGFSIGQQLHSSETLGWTSEPRRTPKKNTQVYTHTKCWRWPLH